VEVCRSKSYPKVGRYAFYTVKSNMATPYPDPYPSSLRPLKPPSEYARGNAWSCFTIPLTYLQCCSNKLGIGLGTEGLGALNRGLREEVNIKDSTRGWALTP
jgi:hypothetical protein